MHWAVIWRSMSVHGKFINESYGVEIDQFAYHTRNERQTTVCCMYLYVSRDIKLSFIYKSIAKSHNTRIQYRTLSSIWNIPRKRLRHHEIRKPKTTAWRKGNVPLICCVAANCYPCFCTVLTISINFITNLTAISSERTHAAVRPLKHRLIEKKKVVAAVWVTAGPGSSQLAVS